MNNWPLWKLIFINIIFRIILLLNTPYKLIDNKYSKITLYIKYYWNLSSLTLNYYTYTYTVDGDANINVNIGGSVSTKKIYLKVNNSWVQYSKVYKKINGSWVEQASSTWGSLFNTTANYVNKD